MTGPVPDVRAEPQSLQRPASGQIDRLRRRPHRHRFERGVLGDDRALHPADHIAQRVADEEGAARLRVVAGDIRGELHDDAVAASQRAVARRCVRHGRAGAAQERPGDARSGEVVVVAEILAHDAVDDGDDLSQHVLLGATRRQAREGPLQRHVGVARRALDEGDLSRGLHHPLLRDRVEQFDLFDLLRDRPPVPRAHGGIDDERPARLTGHPADRWLLCRVLGVPADVGHPSARQMFGFHLRHEEGRAAVSPDAGRERPIGRKEAEAGHVSNVGWIEEQGSVLLERGEPLAQQLGRPPVKRFSEHHAALPSPFRACPPRWPDPRRRKLRNVAHNDRRSQRIVPVRSTAHRDSDNSPILWSGQIALLGSE